MDQATLVSVDVDAGLKVLSALDLAKIQPKVALWMISSDYDDWRLVLSSPALDQLHLLKAHQQLAKALQPRFVYFRPPILLLPIKDPFIRELRRLFAKTSDVNGMRLGGQIIGGRLIVDAYVYRIR